MRGKGYCVNSLLVLISYHRWIADDNRVDGTVGRQQEVGRVLALAPLDLVDFLLNL
jgi:hypothetical protein